MPISGQSVSELWETRYSDWPPWVICPPLGGRKYGHIRFAWCGRGAVSNRKLEGRHNNRGSDTLTCDYRIPVIYLLLLLLNNTHAGFPPSSCVPWKLYSMFFRFSSFISFHLQYIICYRHFSLFSHESMPVSSSWNGYSMLRDWL